MGEAKPFEPEKLIVAVLVSEGNLSRPGYWRRLRARLQETFGPIDYTSRAIPFAFTRYYDGELGAPLMRIFVAFRQLVEPQELARFKTATNALEDELRGPASDAGRPRSVNLDPGLLSLSRLILASTKDSSHRIPLTDGIYAEITLQYRRPCFHPVSWTYPDYRSEEALEALLGIRELLKAQRRAGRHAPPSEPRPR